MFNLPITGPTTEQNSDVVYKLTSYDVASAVKEYNSRLDEGEPKLPTTPEAIDQLSDIVARKISIEGNEYIIAVLSIIDPETITNQEETNSEIGGINND